LELIFDIHELRLGEGLFELSGEDCAGTLSALDRPNKPGRLVGVFDGVEEG
jgi:hypothetical protein